MSTNERAADNWRVSEAIQKPLATWRALGGGGAEVRGRGVTLTAWPDGVWTARIVGGRGSSRADDYDLAQAQLAAEVFARTIVSGLAAALGFRLVDARPMCFYCGTHEPDIVVDGEYQCGRCGAIGGPVEEEARP